MSPEIFLFFYEKLNYLQGKIATNTPRAHVRVLSARNAETPQERDQNLARMSELVAEMLRAMDAYAKVITDAEDAKNFQILKQKRAACVADPTAYIDLLKAEKPRPHPDSALME